MTLVTAPLDGRAIGLDALPDPVFATAMVGPGMAIDPLRHPMTALAPIDGVVMSLRPHAYVVVDDAGHAVLIHLGCDTVLLLGAGFEPLVGNGAVVRRGQPVVRWDPVAIEAAGRSPVCPVVALDAPSGALSGLRDTGNVRTGDSLFHWD